MEVDRADGDHLLDFLVLLTNFTLVISLEQNTTQRNLCVSFLTRKKEGIVLLITQLALQ